MSPPKAEDSDDDESDIELLDTETYRAEQQQQQKHQAATSKNDDDDDLEIVVSIAQIGNESLNYYFYYHDNMIRTFPPSI